MTAPVPAEPELGSAVTVNRLRPASGGRFGQEPSERGDRPCSVTPVEGTSTHAVERASFSAAHRSDGRGRERRHVVGPPHRPSYPARATPVTAAVPPPREPGGFGERTENVRRQNALHNGRAVRTVAARAVDARDCRDLLDMLGLDADAARAEDRPR